MENARLQALFNFLKEDPKDPFTIYAIATEYSGINEIKAMEYYDLLLKEHSAYLPAYYHAAKLYEKMGDYFKAGEVYQKGMELSLRQKNIKAHQELMNAYNEMNFMNEE
jgi:tetratricopeptide (TPR) repeat protein